MQSLSSSLESVTTAEKYKTYFSPPTSGYQPKEDETIYVLIRHGENQSNVDKTYDGRTLNLPLTAKGRKQSEQAGQDLAKRIKQVDHLLLSTMCRTDQSAEEILKSFPPAERNVTRDVRMCERFLSVYEGRPLADYEERRKQDLETSLRTDLSFDEKMAFKGNTPIEQIESFGEVWKRTQPCLLENAQKLKGKVVVAVTHSGTIRAVFWYLAKEKGLFVPYNWFKPLNGAFMVVRVRDNKMSLEETQNIDIAESKE